MDKKEIKNQTNLNDIPTYDYNDKPEEIIPSLDNYNSSSNTTNINNINYANNSNQ